MIKKLSKLTAFFIVFSLVMSYELLPVPLGLLVEDSDVSQTPAFHSVYIFLP
jgi:hypothetical protein